MLLQSPKGKLFPTLEAARCVLVALCLPHASVAELRLWLPRRFLHLTADLPVAQPPPPAPLPASLDLADLLQQLRQYAAAAHPACDGWTREDWVLDAKLGAAWQRMRRALLMAVQ